MNQNMALRYLGVFIVAAAGLACNSTNGWEGAGAATRNLASPGQVKPSIESLQNLSYRGFESQQGSVTLVNGRWQGEPFVEGGASRPEIRFIGDFMLTGDLDGDGSDEAVVLLGENSGGSGDFLYLSVVGRRGGKLENIATRLLGDRVQVYSARLEDGQILLGVVRAGPNDAACCPGELAEIGLGLSAQGELRELSPSGEPERFTLDKLAGTEWVLSSWSIGEPVSPEPAVTLKYQDGKFLGRSGCNTYFASVEQGEMPGQISVGPVGTTRMACPEPIMEMESRFLQQLGSVSGLRFFATQLALTFRGDETAQVMLFDRVESGGESTH